MKILHTADWHIGSFKGPERDGVNLRSEDTMNCLRMMVRTAQEEKPELVLVSGDIFHQAEIWQGRSHREVLQARGIILELSKAAKHVIVMRGTPNHDSEEAFEELKAHFEFVDNVCIVTQPEIINTLHFDIVAVPGFDKGAFRAAHPGISKEDENIFFSDELGNIVTGMRSMCNPNKACILMSHYTVPGCNTESGQTQFLTQFEPVITQDMLLATNYDLVALGHIHRPQTILGLKNVYYSGAINAMNFNDEGQERGFWIHNFTLDPVRHRVNYQSSAFYTTPYRKFQTITWSVIDVAESIANPEMLPIKFSQIGVADKIVRIIYSCTADQKRAINTAQIERALYEAGAFFKADIIMERLEAANRTELSKFDDPEENLIQYLNEKLILPEQVASIVERARPIIAKALANEAVSEFTGTFTPKNIEVKNYRNYVETSFDFADISFCTINGQNGAGKSSLFMDAIVDCLYEEPREGSNTGWIRNDENARSGSISFTFGLGEKIFRVVRTRTKSGKATLNLSELVENDWVNRSKEKLADTQKEIIRILGMDSLTFKACVLIMQDQYGIFLEADKSERITVLSNLLGLGVYGIMEDLAGQQLRELKREIATRKTTIEVHTTAINEYGDPQTELTDMEVRLKLSQSDLDSVSKTKEDKVLLLRMQQEAEERRSRVQASVNALAQKKAATEQNIKIQDGTIANCNDILSSEAETLEKVKRHTELTELDKEYAKAAVAYSAKEAELVRIHNQQEQEEATIRRLQLKVETNQNAINASILESVNDGKVRAKADEYEQTKKQLDEAYEQERAYIAVEQELALARSERAEVCSRHHALQIGMDGKLEGYRKQAELLDGVKCVDIENAKCGFLAEAISAKKMLEEYPAEIARKEAEHKEQLAPHDAKIAELETKLSEMARGQVAELQARAAQLKPYIALLEEINQRESNIALIRGSIENMQSNIGEAEKRLAEVKLKGKEIEREMSDLKEKSEFHQQMQREISQLSVYVQNMSTFAVIKERKKNAENQRADEVLRLVEVERELEAAQKELEQTTGATVDTTSIMTEIADLTRRMESITRQITTYQQGIGSLHQKLGEISRLRNEIAALNAEVKDLGVAAGESQMLKNAFGQDGIPHQIIRSLIPRLTETASSILGQMTGGNMGIEFRTEKIQKNDQEKVALDVFIEEYGKSVLPYMSKSGGEKVKAALSVILALAEVKSSTAGIQLGMLFIDEPPFLDGEGSHAYCDALETIQSRYPDLKIMAITHDQTMKARFPQSLDVVKTETGSKVIY